MFKWLRRLFESPSIKVIRETPFTPTVQEDPRVQESIKRTRTAFKKQQQDMQTRALKPHAVTCKDPLACKTTKCFVWEPDKIVSEPKEVESSQQIKARMKNKKGNYKS